MRVLVAMVLALSSSAAIGQSAPPPPPDGYGPPGGPGATPPTPNPTPGGYQAPLPFQHDGLFLRAYLGVGYGRFGTDDPNLGQVIMDGGGAGLAVSAGWTIQPNLILYLELVADAVGQPDVTVDGVTQETGNDVGASVVAFGPGLAYYTPTNLFMSGTLGISQLTVTDDDEEVFETEAGLGFSGMLGKEWWLSPTFALGLAGQLFLGSMPDEIDEDVTWGAFALTLGVTATYN